MHSFKVDSNESACRKSGRLGLEQVSSHMLRHTRRGFFLPEYTLHILPIWWASINKYDFPPMILLIISVPYLYDVLCIINTQCRLCFCPIPFRTYFYFHDLIAFVSYLIGRITQIHTHVIMCWIIGGNKKTFWYVIFLLYAHGKGIGDIGPGWIHYISVSRNYGLILPDAGIMLEV